MFHNQNKQTETVFPTSTNTEEGASAYHHVNSGLSALWDGSWVLRPSQLTCRFLNICKVIFMSLVILHISYLKKKCTQFFFLVNRRIVHLQMTYFGYESVINLHISEVTYN